MVQETMDMFVSSDLDERLVDSLRLAAIEQYANN